MCVAHVAMMDFDGDDGGQCVKRGSALLRDVLRLARDHSQETSTLP